MTARSGKPVREPVQDGQVVAKFPMHAGRTNSDKSQVSGVVLNNVAKRFGDITIIPDMSIEIQQGEFVVIAGPPGCGNRQLSE